MDWFKRVSMAQRVGAVFGGIYVLVGLAGFVVTSGVGFAETQGATLIAFDVNPLHNLVHIAIGLALIGAAGAGSSASRTMNTVVGATYLLVGLAGFALIGGSLNILALNQADNALHLTSAAVLIVSGVRPERTREVESKQPDAEIRQRTETGLTSGDVVDREGVYRCSCGEFAVLLKEGGTLPRCTVGSGHHFRFSGTPKRKAAAASR